MKKLFSVILALTMVIVLSVQSAALEYLVPISVKGATGTITLTVEAQTDGHKETYSLELNETNNYELLRKLEPNDYQIVNAEDEEGNSVILDKYEFTIEDSSNAQSVVLNVSMKASERAKKYSHSIFGLLDIGNSDIAALVVLVILVVMYYIIKKKKERDFEKTAEDSVEQVQGQREPNHSIKVTEYVPDEEKK